MPLFEAGQNDGAAGVIAGAGYASIHTAAPNSSGSNESAAARKAIGWTTPATGDSSNTADILITGGTPGGPATHVGVWSALTVGTIKGYSALTGDQTFNAAGEYTIRAGELDLNGTTT
jgi:hypothetical protein